MTKAATLFFIFLTLFTGFAIVAAEIEKPTDNSKDLVLKFAPSSIDNNFKQAITVDNYSLETLDTLESFVLVDNLRHVKSLFDFQEAEGFFSYQRLDRYYITNKGKGTSARLYSFRFESSEEAVLWFNTIESSHVSHRLMVFGKPKKVMALVGSEVILIEGYNMSDYKALHFLINQIDGVEVILGPKEIKRLKP